MLGWIDRSWQNCQMFFFCNIETIIVLKLKALLWIIYFWINQTLFTCPSYVIFWRAHTHGDRGRQKVKDYFLGEGCGEHFIIAIEYIALIPSLWFIMWSLSDWFYLSLFVCIACVCPFIDGIVRLKEHVVFTYIIRLFVLGGNWMHWLNAKCYQCFAPYLPYQ